MTAFVIHAAGPGTRMGRYGEHLHKALLPLGGKAVISWQIGLAPPGARIIVCTGHRASQVRDYLELAHPGQLVTFVDVPGWDQTGAGPGASLLAARRAVGDDDLIFTPCDTLWAPDERLWQASMSWAGVAPVPAGSPPGRWCRISVSARGRAVAFHDKTPAGGGQAFTGLAMVLRRDLAAFWDGLATSRPAGGERQVAGGLDALIRRRLIARQVHGWTDTGDQEAYATAVAAASGYDWTKPGEATWVLPDQNRVVKFSARQDALSARVRRQQAIAAVTPKLAGTRPQMAAWEYAPGMPAYDVPAGPDLIRDLLDWAAAFLWQPVRVSAAGASAAAFYQAKTARRTAMLAKPLRGRVRAAVARIRWAELAEGCEPVTFHGDFNLGNVIVGQAGGFRLIDWRDDFAGQDRWGDRRYDLAKLAAGMVVHWGRARRGDFAPWPEGQAHLDQIGRWLGGLIPGDVQIIAALTLLNSAPLHVPPLDAVLADRGCAWLEDLL